MCMRPDLFEQKREDTPEHIRKYRQSYKQQPGAILVHPGLHDDMNRIDRGYTQGKATPASLQMDKVVKCQNFTGLADKFNEIKESQYATHKKEPLGRGLTRDYEWPTAVKENTSANNDFAFGITSNQCDKAKDLIFPARGANNEKPEYA